MESLRHFACTQCGKCCNRSPEVELSEAAPLADVFVFRLLFRLYRQPRFVGRTGGKGAAAFYERKRMLTAHAAKTYSTKAVLDGKPTEHINYLMISALALDTRREACPALENARCSIYDRRPATCRTVPLHYSRVESGAVEDFDAFVKTPGYRCDISPGAPLVLEGGRIADPTIREDRHRATMIVARDFAWKQAIARAMKVSSDGALPTLRAVEENAEFGALTTSIRVAWQIASRAGLLGERDVLEMTRAQLAIIDRELEEGHAPWQAMETLRDMRAEYVEALAR